MGKVNIKQLNVAPASGYVIGSGAGGVPVWKLEVTSVAWNQITGNQALVNLSGFTNDSGFITLGSLSAGTGISYNNLTGVITNSAPDQTVVLTQGTGITITGTYPNFTISSNGNQTITLSGDVTGSGTTGIVTTIANNSVTDAKIRQSVGLSVIGRSAGTTGDVADITGTTGQALRISGGVLGFGQIALGTIAATNTRIPFGQVGASLGESANLTYDGTILSATSIINATIGFRVANSATSGNYLRGDGTNYISSSLLASDLAINSISNTLIRQSAGLSVVGRSANTTGDIADITAASDLHVLRRSGTTIGFGTVQLGGIAATGTNIPHAGGGGVLVQATNFNFSGNVLGIGPTSPVSTGRIHIARATVDCGITSDHYSNTAGAGNLWYSRRSRGTTIGTASTTNIGDFLGGFFFEGVSSSNVFGAAARILVTQTEASGAITVGSKIELRSYSTGVGANTNALVVAANGNTGFNTDTPTSRVDVVGDVEIDLASAFYLGDPTTDGTWRIIRSGNDLLSQRRESGSYVTKQTITP